MSCVSRLIRFEMKIDTEAYFDFSITCLVASPGFQHRMLHVAKTAPFPLGTSDRAGLGADQSGVDFSGQLVSCDGDAGRVLP